MRYEAVRGVEWCAIHQGVMDEASDRVDKHGAPSCDMRGLDATKRCESRVLYIRRAS